MGFFDEDEEEDKGGFFGHINEEREERKRLLRRRPFGLQRTLGTFRDLADFDQGFKPGLPEPKASTVTQEQFRLAQPDILKRGAGMFGLSGIVEGGLRAATGREVPTELTAFTGEGARGETVDLRGVTSTKGLGPAEKALVLGGRVGEGIRRGVSELAEGQRNLFGVDAELQSLSPVRATEDRRIVSAPKGALEHIADIAGESVPIVSTSIASGGASGLSRFTGEAIAESIANRAARFAAHRGVNLVENLALSTLATGEVPTPAEGGVMLGMDIALAGAGKGVGFAGKKLVGKYFGEVADAAHTAVSRRADLDLDGQGIVKALEQEAEVLDAGITRGSAPVRTGAEPNRVRLAEGPETPLGEPGGAQPQGVAGGVEPTFLGQAPITPGTAPVPQGPVAPGRISLGEPEALPQGWQERPSHGRVFHTLDTPDKGHASFVEADGDLMLQRIGRGQATSGTDIVDQALDRFGVDEIKSYSATRAGDRFVQNAREGASLSGPMREFLESMQARGRVRIDENGDVFLTRGQEPTFLGQAPISPGSAEVPQGPIGPGRISFGEAPPTGGPTPGPGQAPGGPTRATPSTPGALRAALEASLAKETGQESGVLVDRATQAAGDSIPEVAMGTAALPDARARANFLKNVADDPEFAGAKQAENAVPLSPTELGSGLNPIRLVKLLSKAMTSKRMSELYVNATLLTPGPMWVNFANNLQNMLMLPAVRGVEAGLATGQRASNAISQFFLKKNVFDNPGQATFVEAYKILQGYATGVKHFSDSLQDIGRLYRAKIEAAEASGIPIQQLERQDIDAIEGFLKADATQFSEGFTNYLYAARAIFGETDNIIRRAPSEELAASGVLKAEGLDRPQLPGLGGKAIRSSTNFLGATDAAFKDAIWHGERAAMAPRMAVKYGEPVEFVLGPAPVGNPARFDKWSTIQDEMMAASNKQARYQTLTNDLGPVLQKGLELRNSLGFLGTLLSPFYTTPFNAVKYTLRHSPVGLFEDASRIGLKAATGVGENRTPDEIIESVSRGVVGTALMAGAWQLMATGIIGQDSAGDNENFIGVSGGPEFGAESRTIEAAAGGVRTGYTLRIGDNHFDLRRMGLPGMTMGISADVLKRYQDLQAARIERGEALDERGAWEDREQAWNETLGTAMNFGGLASFGVSSAMTNNLFNETALSDTLDLMNQLNQAGKRGDQEALTRIADQIAETAARAAQPFTALSHASSALGEPITSPHPEEGLLGRFGQAVDKRIPGDFFGESLSEFEPIAQRDIFGEERRPRYAGDQENYAVRLASKLFMPYGGASEETGGPEIDRNAAMATEMRRLGVFKDFPRLTEDIEKLFPDSETIEHVQMVRGEYRSFFLENLFSNPEYEALSDEDKAKVVERTLNRADSQSAEVLENLVLQQASERRPLDMRELDSAIIGMLDLEFGPREEEQDESLQLQQR